MAELLPWADAALLGTASAAERAGWAAKEDEARAILAGTAKPSLLAVEAAITGEEIESLARRIVAKSDRLRDASMALAGLRRVTARLIDEALPDGLEAARIADIVAR